jgi:hypothetical protein
MGISCLSLWREIRDVFYPAAGLNGIKPRIFRGLAAASGRGTISGIGFAQLP